MSDEREQKISSKESRETYNTVTEEPVTKVSALGKIGMVVVSPVQAMKAVRNKPTVLLVMMVVAILPLLYYIPFWKSYEVQMIQMLERQFASQGIEPTREMMAMSLNLIKYTTPVSAALGNLFGALIGSVIYFGISRLMKKEVTYKQTFSMVLHAMVVANMIWLVHILITTITGQSNILSPMTSIASLLPEDMYGTVLYGLLMPIEVVAMWHAVVLFIGLRVVCRMSQKAAGIIVGVSILISMLMGATSFLMSGIGGM